MKLPTQLLSLGLATACAMLASCANTSPKAVANDSFVLSIEDDRVSVSCESPMSVPEFLKLAQSITSRPYTYRKDEATGEVEWVGTITCERKQFGEFVQAMLHAQGLAVQPRQQGGMEILEVRAIKRG